MVADDAQSGEDGRHGSQHGRPTNPSLPGAPRRAIRPLLLLIALVTLAWSLYQLPVSRVVESRLCHDYYAAHDPSVLPPAGNVPEELCKLDEVQQQLGRIQGVMDAMWVAGDFVMTIPLVSLADHYGYRFVLCLNLVPRIFLLGWTFMVGYFDQALPVNAILAAPALSFLGGDCVFNSVVYSLIADLTDDHILRATFFGYANAISSIFSLQLGPALASAIMTTLLWLPLWLGLFSLLLAIPVISMRPPAIGHQAHQEAACQDPTDTVNTPLLSSSARLIRRTNLHSLTASRFHTILAILTKPSRNFLLLLACFFLASFASSDTKLLPLYISKRYHWKFSSVGYLLSLKALFNFFLLSFLIPRVVRWRRRRRSSPHPEAQAQAQAQDNNSIPETAADKETITHAHVCLVFSVLGALAIALAPTAWALVPSLLLYALGIALPMFTYSLLRSPSMALQHQQARDRGSGPGTQLFSVVMLVRTAGTLLGAVAMPSLWVAGLSVGGVALGLPYGVSAVCYAVAGVVVKKIRVG
ncbi:hypothetical protein N656DRAFT_798136 [Canariomyces notabilis]|uniref:Major facilitator superfamily transporter n=1 Tax=Canariomyces notabilis TaxID=2074819 RepID=A0AAN6YRP4_9PEZI|nr:hypothetical protein N656DRAFT_798136 [Canariomyces arenarius]